MQNDIEIVEVIEEELAIEELDERTERGFCSTTW